MDTELLRERLNELCACAGKTAAEIGEAARNGAVRAGQTAENVVHYARVKISILDLKAEISTRMRTVGELVYATHTGNPSDSGTIETVLAEIDDLKSEVRRKTRELGSIRGVKVCPFCGSPNGSDDVFCSNCGEVLEDGADGE